MEKPCPLERLAPGSHLEWDFDPSDGIGANGQKAYDAVGAALHEIGHSLGFYSEIDDIDYYAGLFSKDEWDGFVAPLDLYRYETVEGRFSRSFRIGSTSQSFSLDGETVLGGLSTGAYYGDGFQEGHWHEGSTDPYGPSGFGLMKPVSYKDRPNAIQGLDLAAFDAIGWNVRPVPEPATLAALGLGVAAVLRRRKKA